MNSTCYCLKCKKTFTEGDVILTYLPPKCPHCGSWMTTRWKIISQLAEKIAKYSIHKEPWGK